MNKQYMCYSLVFLMSFLGMHIHADQPRSAASEYLQKVEKERDESLRTYMSNMGAFGAQKQQPQQRKTPVTVTPAVRPTTAVAKPNPWITFIPNPHQIGRPVGPVSIPTQEEPRGFFTPGVAVKLPDIK